MSAVRFQRQLGLSRYETAFGILHKLRAGMVRPHRDRIGGSAADQHIEVGETYLASRTPGGVSRRAHQEVLIACAVEVRGRRPVAAQDRRQDDRYAGRARLAIVPDRSGESLCGFIESTVIPAALIVTDGWSGYAGLSRLGYTHSALAGWADPGEPEDRLPPMTRLVLASLRAWLPGIHHKAGATHLPACLNEYTFRFNHRFHPFTALRCMLGIEGGAEAPAPDLPESGGCVHPGTLPEGAFA